MWSILDWSVSGNQILIFWTFQYSIYVLSVAGRNLIFVSTFKLRNQKSVFEHILGHQHGKSGFLLQTSCFGWVFIFLLSFQNAQNTQNVYEKTRILVYKPWKFKSNTVLSLICRGVLTIQSNISNKRVGKKVQGD